MANRSEYFPGFDHSVFIIGKIQNPDTPRPEQAEFAVYHRIFTEKEAYTSFVSTEFAANAEEAYTQARTLVAPSILYQAQQTVDFLHIQRRLGHQENSME